MNTTPLAHQVSFHPPADESVKQRHEDVRAAALDFARKLSTLCPPGVELEHAIEAAREAMFWANAGIACHPTAPTHGQ